MKFSVNQIDRKKSGIYIITNSVDSRVYVGSAKNILNRYDRHNQAITNKKHHSYKIRQFVAEYGSDSLTFSVLRFCKQSELIELEQIYIDSFDACESGFNCNPIAGSWLGRKHRSESVEKLRNKVVTPEARANYSAWQKGKPKSEEIKAKWSDGRRKGIAKSDEFKRKMSERMKGNQSAKGHVQTEEHKKKRTTLSGLSQRGRVFTEEHRKKLSENSTVKGVKKSEEYKAKMREHLMNSEKFQAYLARIRKT